MHRNTPEGASGVASTLLILQCCVTLGLCHQEGEEEGVTSTALGEASLTETDEQLMREVEEEETNNSGMAFRMKQTRHFSIVEYIRPPLTFSVLLAAVSDIAYLTATEVHATQGERPNLTHKM